MGLKTVWWWPGNGTNSEVYILTFPLLSPDERHHRAVNGGSEGCGF